MGKWGVRAVWAVVVLLLVFAAFRSTKPDREEQKRRLKAADPALVQASKELLRPFLSGVSLGMDMHEVLAARPRLKRHVEADRENLKVFQEALPPDGQALYFFASDYAGIGGLARVQIAKSLSGLEAVAARVEMMANRFGPPTGVWDCPSRAGQLATRRYTYGRGAASAMDAYVLIAERASATFYVAARAQIRRSIAEAGCVSTPPERAARFPVAVPTATR